MLKPQCAISNRLKGHMKMPETRWYGQKEGASSLIKGLLSDGAEKPITELVSALQVSGLSRKNSLKAIYSEVAEGLAVVSGKWTDGTVKKGGA